MKIKSTLILSLIFMTTACVSSKNSQENSQAKNYKQRTVASQQELSGTYLAVANYINHGRKPAVRFYLNEIKSEPGSYYAVLLEYANLLKVFPKYVASNKFEDLSKEIGFLNHIVEKIWLYKVVPSGKAGHFYMLELKADNKSIVALESDNPRQLVLSQDSNLAYPLEGAKIFPSKTGQSTEIFFPKKSTQAIVHGTEFSIAHLVYGRIGLDSTWRDEFLPGPYLSAYGNKDDVVLKLFEVGKDMRAYFEVPPKYIRKNMSRGQIAKREDMFTNPRSAFLEGGFVMREPVDGMFTFSPMFTNASADSINQMRGHIGVFIDIFDARAKLNQDVVELISVNTEDPLDFHMHYEDPENGDGAAFKSVE